MRKALVVGIDYYSNISGLFGCVNDAHNVKAVLERNGNGTVNFDVKFVSCTGKSDLLPRADLKNLVRELFSDRIESAVFYFAGHGHIESTGGYLCASDCKTGDDGLSLTDIMTFANSSPAQNRIIVLDSCHSGIAGNPPCMADSVVLCEGMTILTASTADQYANEKNSAGVFTTLFVDALNGAASNLVGDITPGSVYAHIDQSLGPWQQRPVFKTNVSSFVSLRKVAPPISLSDLHRLPTLFPNPDHEYALNPSYEPESNCPDHNNTETFAMLQRMNRVNLVVPVGTIHMYFAAMESRACKLTVLGKHYHRLVTDNRI